MPHEVTIRVFLTPQVAKLQRDERLGDSVFCEVAGEVLRGELGVGEANLGGGLFKERVGRANKGKSDGYRMIVGYRTPNSERVLFAYGFPKSVASTLTPAGRKALTIVARDFIAADDKKVLALLKDGKVKEVKCDDGAEEAG
ncbi:type II toxin-antitoxin system RelE/ParE family toxin [Siccirubricoccus phaeus]|uniref:type II toxin-antitoxin system RelE/ParE family toxin n=1 Tax=Siccirubricoccus phaeus TaxID=2595053 RepID=UPI0011F2C759|nr:type II toxin-antitoxin system RelE/ParE family toxin [Siccirubricoccus phaeus]